MPKLTKGLIERADVKNRPYFIFDDQLTGFCVRVSPNGKCHYYTQYTSNKRVKRMAIGQHGTITTEQARDLAFKMIATIKAGADPLAEKLQKRSEPLVLELAGRYIADHVELRCKPNTKKGYKRFLAKFIIPYFGHMRVTDVTKTDLANFQTHFRHTPYEINRCLEMISKMFNLAELWGMRQDGSNPCRHIKKFPEKKNERYLSKEEVKRLGLKLEELKRFPRANFAAIYCVQLLLMTGCRVGEILTLKWEYVDLENHLLRLPDSKTGAKIVYLGVVATEPLHEIKNCHARPPNNPYVIWGREINGPMNSIQSAWDRIRTLVGLQDVRLHDLRHSFASFAVSQGISLPMVGKLLGHKQVQTTARYAHLMADPMKEAATQVTAQLGCIMNIKTTPLPSQPILPEPETEVMEHVEAYLSQEEAAEYLGVSPSLMKNWRWRKIGPVYMKIGPHVGYKTTDLNDYLREHKINKRLNNLKVMAPSHQSA